MRVPLPAARMIAASGRVELSSGEMDMPLTWLRVVSEFSSSLHAVANRSEDPLVTVRKNWPAKTRTWNAWTKTRCVANYTTGHAVNADRLARSFRSSAALAEDRTDVAGVASWRPITLPCPSECLRGGSVAHSCDAPCGAR